MVNSYDTLVLQLSIYCLYNQLTDEFNDLGSSFLAKPRDENFEDLTIPQPDPT